MSGLTDAETELAAERVEKAEELSVNDALFVALALALCVIGGLMAAERDKEERPVELALGQADCVSPRLGFAVIVGSELRDTETESSAVVVGNAL